MTDTVTLSIPRNPQYYSVVRMVVGGIAAGLQLSYDALDDLQLAIGTLLDRDDLQAAGEVTLRLEVDDDRMRASLGTFRSSSLQQAFSADGNGEGEFGLRRLLDTIVDEVDVSQEGDGEWVTLTKRVKAAAV